MDAAVGTIARMGDNGTAELAVKIPGSEPLRVPRNPLAARLRMGSLCVEYGVCIASCVESHQYSVVDRPE